MKFLVIARPRPIQQGVTSAMVQATREIANRNIKSGKIDCLYRFAGGNGTCAIVNAESGDALEEMLLEAPSFPFLEFETHALAGADKYLDKVIEGMKKQGL
jgi:muconolactone delta-isomerase